MILSSQDPSGNLPTFQTSPATSLFLQQGPPSPAAPPPVSFYPSLSPLIHTFSSQRSLAVHAAHTLSRARRQPHLSFYTISYKTVRPGRQPYKCHKRRSGTRVRRCYTQCQTQMSGSCQPGKSFSLPTSTHNTRRALPPQTESK